MQLKRIMQKRARHLPRPGLAAVALAGVLVLVASACGGADPTATPAPTATRAPAPTAPAQATPTPAAAATRAPQATATTAAPAPQATATRAPAATSAPRPTATTVPTGVPTPQAFPNAKYGGALLRSIPTQGPSWDTWFERTANTHDVTQTVYDGLLLLNPQNEAQLAPQLADSWEISKDGMTYTFRIHKGVMFHNGTELKARDVKWSFDTQISPPKDYMTISVGLLGYLASVDAPDDYTVVMKLREPDASFLSVMAYGRMHILSKAWVEADGGLPRLSRWPLVGGTGPFMTKPEGHVRAVSTEVVKNPNYFVKGRPFLDSQKFFYIPDVGTTLAAFLTGQINFGFGANATQARELQSRLGDRVTIERTPTLAMTRAILDIHPPSPFADPKVREAVSWAINRDGAITALRQGLAIKSGVIIPGTGWEIPEAELLKVPGYSGNQPENIAKAKALLTAAGHPRGFKTKVWTRTLAQYQEAAVVVVAYLKEAGLDVSLEAVDDATYFEKQVDLNVWDIQLGVSQYRGTDPNLQIRDQWITGALRNLNKVSDKKADELDKLQNLEQDPVKRKAIVNEFERLHLGLYHNSLIMVNIALNAWYSYVKNMKFQVSRVSNMHMRDVWIDKG